MFPRNPNYVKKKIAVIACSNGLGHIRRLILIITFMLKNDFNHELDFFCSKEKLKVLKDWDETSFLLNSNVNIKEFEYPNNQSISNEKLIDKNWFEIDLPDLSSYDMVWTDNISQVLEVRDDAILSGSFFWHEVLEKYDDNKQISSFVNSQRKLIDKVNPFMVGNEYFATNEVRSLKNFIPVGLYKFSSEIFYKNSNNILLSCGLGGEEEDLADDAVSQIISMNIKPPGKLFVEPKILPKIYPSWMEPANFSMEMFNSCLAVCIRPGLGTVSDALVSQNKIFCFSKPNSFEMNNNIKILEEMGMGERCKGPLEAYKKAIKYLSNKEDIKKQLLNSIHLRTDGVFATARFIMNRINNRMTQ